MPNYRRNYQPGGTFFFTLVTAARQPIFSDPAAVSLLRQCVRDARKTRPFVINAAVILWDHLHMIWTLPLGDSNYSTRWNAIKSCFTRTWLAGAGHEIEVSNAKARQRYRGIWQARFMEHTCRDEMDLATHVDYIHFNPVKHGYVTRPVDWPHSSIHHYIRAGNLPATWGTIEMKDYGDGVNESLLE